MESVPVNEELSGELLAMRAEDLRIRDVAAAQESQLPDSAPHTRGFCERTAALYHYVPGDATKAPVLAAVPGGRWRIDGRGRIVVRDFGFVPR
jgi:hypothetical protein